MVSGAGSTVAPAAMRASTRAATASAAPSWKNGRASQGEPGLAEAGEGVGDGRLGHQRTRMRPSAGAGSGALARI